MNVSTLKVAPSSGKYFRALDGVRGVAVLLVVLCHSFYFNPAHPVQRVLQSVNIAGWIGVPIFFVLSGFLISLSVIASNGPFDWRAYAMRRVGKIAPAFVLAVIVFSVFRHYAYGATNTVLAAIYNLTTLAHFVDGWNFLDRPLWSLFIELHFYVVFPVVYLAFARFFKNPDILTAVVFLVVPTAFRLLVRPVPSAGDWSLQYNLFPRSLDYFGWGILFSVIFTRWRDRAARYSVAASHSGCALLIFSYCFYGYLQYRFSISGSNSFALSELFRYLPSLGAFLLLFTCISPRTILRDILCSTVLVYMGLVSYEWYLFHDPLMDYIYDNATHSQGSIGRYLAKTLVPAVCLFGFSALVYHLLSEPVLLKAKAYRKSSTSC